MTLVDQMALFSPSGDEAIALALKHGMRAAAYEKSASVCDARGWYAAAGGLRKLARREEFEAECLAMLVEFEHLANADPETAL